MAFIQTDALCANSRSCGKLTSVIGLGWLLAPTGWPGLRWLFDHGYEWFARNRIAIGRIFGRKCDSGVCDVVGGKKP